MNNKLIKKWVNIFKNEEEFCSGELAKNLGIYIFETEMDKLLIKDKLLKAYYLRSDKTVGVYIDDKKNDEEKYMMIKEIFFKIIDSKLQYEYFFYDPQ